MAWKNIVIFTWDYGTGKTTTMAKYANQFWIDSLIFDFTQRVVDNQKFSSARIATILMWCNWCSDSAAYTWYITSAMTDETLFVEVPNDRINLGAVVRWLENNWYTVHVIWLWNCIQNTRGNLLQTFSAINMSYTNLISGEINTITDLFVGHQPIWNEGYQWIESSKNHNAGWFLKPCIDSNDINRIKQFIDNNQEKVTRLKWQFYYQWDEKQSSWWYDIERVKKSNMFTMLPIATNNIQDHSIALVSEDIEVRKTFNKQMIWKVNEKPVSAESINKREFLSYNICYKVIVWQENFWDIFQSIIISNDFYDYRLLFTEKMRNSTQFITDERRKKYFKKYYMNKVWELKLLYNSDNNDIIDDNKSTFLLTLSNLIFLFREEANTDMVMPDWLPKEVYEQFTPQERLNFIEKAITFSTQGSPILEFNQERIQWYKDLINWFNY